MRQMKHIALLGGSESFVVNQNRYKGYQQAYQEAGREVEETLVYRNLESCAFMDRAVEEVLEKGADCIVCMDDAICIQVLRKLRQEHIKVPQDIRVASFYNSPCSRTIYHRSLRCLSMRENSEWKPVRICWRRLKGRRYRIGHCCRMK